MAVVGDRAGALNALASGGSAGLDAYKQAQAKQADYQRQAIDAALGGRGVGIPSEAAAEVAGLVKSRTSGYANDAASGVSLATEQMGYDSSALDSFLAQQQKKLDQQRREAEQNMDVSRIQHQGRVSAWQRQYDASQAAAGDNSLASWFAQLDKEDQDALVKGTAQALQGQEMSQAQRDLAGQKSAAVKQQFQKPATGETPGKGVMTNEAYAQAQKSAGDIPGRGVMKPEAYAQAQRSAMAEAAQERTARVEALQAALSQMQLRVPDYQQKVAAELYGMNQFLAMGRYPNDEKAISERRKEIDDYLAYIPGASQADAERAYNDDLDALNRDKWEQAGLSWEANKDGAESAGMSPQKAGEFAQHPEFANVAAAAEDYRTQTDKTAQQRYAGFEDEVNRTYPGEVNAPWRAYVLGYFRQQIMTGNRDIYSVTDGTTGG